jgi:GT2 family glycosyltransferase
VLLFDLLGYVSRKLDKRQLTLGNLVSTGHHHKPPLVKNSLSPKVSIVIPTRDKHQLLADCVQSISKLTSYPNFEIIVVNNNSSQVETKRLLDQFRKNGIVVLDYPKEFNFSAICNLAASKATGDFLCFLNNDTKITEPRWLEFMVDHATQPEVGLVGALLTFPNGKLQHMGIAIKLQGIASHPFRGDATSGRIPTDCFQVSAVTFALAMISSAKFDNLGGLDENFPVGYNDVDIGIRSREKGWKNVVCVSAHTNHAESQTRSKSRSIRGIIQASQDVIKFLRKHPKLVPENFFTR